MRVLSTICGAPLAIETVLAVADPLAWIGIGTLDCPPHPETTMAVTIIIA
jgi:hypothetical protein